MTQYVLSGDPAPTGTRRLHRVAPTVWTRVPGFVATLALFGATASAAQSTARRDPVVLQLQREIRDATDLSRQQLGFVADWARAEALVVLEQATAAGGSTVLEERATSLANAARLLEALEEDAERLEQAALAINRESARTAIWTGAGVSLLQLWADGWSALTGEATGDDMRRTTSELRLRLDEVTAIGSALDTVSGARRFAARWCAPHSFAGRQTGGGQRSGAKGRFGGGRERGFGDSEAASRPNKAGGGGGSARDSALG